MKNDDDVGRTQRIKRALALADGGHADPGPARNRVDAHFVDVGAEFIGGGKSGLDVLAARA